MLSFIHSLQFFVPKDFCMESGLPCHSIEKDIFSRRRLGVGLDTVLKNEAKCGSKETDFLPVSNTLRTSL